MNTIPPQPHPRYPQAVTESSPNPTPKLSRAESARINGAKSRGPKTAADKRNSRANSLRHGFAAKVLQVPLENHPDFPAFLTVYLAGSGPIASPAQLTRLTHTARLEFAVLQRQTLQKNLLNAEAAKIRSEANPPDSTQAISARAFFRLLNSRSGLRAALELENTLSNRMFKALEADVPRKQKIQRAITDTCGSRT